MTADQSSLAARALDIIFGIYRISYRLVNNIRDEH